jgi:transcriptional regulator with GAF, ATPase, and Fis domain
MIDTPITFAGSATVDDRYESKATYSDLLTNVWREACRHIEIGETVATIVALLAEQIPLAQVLVRQIDAQRGSLETMALGMPEAAPLLPELRTECSVAQLSDLLDWCGRATVAHTGEHDLEPALWAVLAGGLRQDVLVGPLNDSEGPRGLLILIAPGTARFRAEHAELAQVLLEPFAVALTNDRRVQEMAALRATAEADKQTLLTKLGRKEIADQVVGADTGLRSVMERVELVTRSDVPVLILGETGTGKELIARVIHTRSARSQGPFLRVNCGAIPTELIDSQLFGHDRGAFTGAVETRQGWFERAHGGTLLLDEIGELPLAAQVRLLRILQDGWLERVGGHQPIHVDVRIVAATHRDLATMVAEGTFREDLWYRIAVFPISLPPLRERVADIPAIARHFAERAAVRFSLPLALPTAEDNALLAGYPWPGNIRELGAVIDRAAILGDGKRLEVATALGVSTQHAAPPAAITPVRPPETDGRPSIPSLDEAMKQHIETALTLAKGRIEGPRGAARLLKINPHTLRARMRKLGIDWQRFREPESW